MCRAINAAISGECCGPLCGGNSFSQPLTVDLHTPSFSAILRLLWPSAERLSDLRQQGLLPPAVCRQISIGFSHALVKKSWLRVLLKCFTYTVRRPCSRWSESAWDAGKQGPGEREHRVQSTEFAATSGSVDSQGRTAAREGSKVATKKKTEFIDSASRPISNKGGQCPKFGQNRLELARRPRNRLSAGQN